MPECQKLPTQRHLAINSLTLLIPFMYDRFLNPPFVTSFLLYRSFTNTFSFLYTIVFVYYVP